GTGPVPSPKSPPVKIRASCSFDVSPRVTPPSTIVQGCCDTSGRAAFFITQPPGSAKIAKRQRSQRKTRPVFLCLLCDLCIFAIFENQKLNSTEQRRLLRLDALDEPRPVVAGAVDLRRDRIRLHRLIGIRSDQIIQLLRRRVALLQPAIK